MGSSPLQSRRQIASLLLEHAYALQFRHTAQPAVEICHLYKVDDNIESIMLRESPRTLSCRSGQEDSAVVAMSVRGTGSYIKGTNGESQGVIPFLKLHNDQLVAVNQGGKRRGLGRAYLETWHNDIEDFLKLRNQHGDERRRTHDLNTANWVPDLFMKRMEAREQWTLFRSNEVPDLHDAYGRKFEERYLHYERLAREGKIYGRSIPAIDLWKEMLKALFETGHPWLTFKDACGTALATRPRRRNPLVESFPPRSLSIAARKRLPFATLVLSFSIRTSERTARPYLKLFEKQSLLRSERSIT